VKICPVNALQEEDYPAGLTDKKTCAARSEELFKRYISPCGFCIKVCPVGEDRKQYHREQLRIYDESDPEYSDYHKAWDHVRSYGGK
jgi:epoxyqueuosine reductase QueG